MHFVSNFRVRGISVGLFLAMGAVLAACASGPAPHQASGAAAAGAQTYTGRLQIVITDQNAAPLDEATVDLRAMGTAFYRASSRTDRQGMVTFNGVPPQVEVDVVASGGNGSGSQVANVAQDGASELRLVVQTYADDSQQSTPGQAGAGGAGGAGAGAGAGGSRGRR